MKAPDRSLGLQWLSVNEELGSLSPWRDVGGESEITGGHITHQPPSYRLAMNWLPHSSQQLCSEMGKLRHGASPAPPLSTSMVNIR